MMAGYRNNETPRTKIRGHEKAAAEEANSKKGDKSRAIKRRAQASMSAAMAGGRLGSTKARMDMQADGLRLDARTGSMSRQQVKAADRGLQQKDRRAAQQRSGAVKGQQRNAVARRRYRRGRRS